MKRYFIPILIIAAVGSLSAQQPAFDEPVGEPDATLIGIDSAQQMLQEISLSRFEDAGMWRALMPRDFGFATIRKIAGGPQDKQPIEAEQQAGIDEADDYVLGVKAYYYHRAMEYIQIEPARPIPIEGVCKVISLWVVGRNYEHVLKVLLEDYYGNAIELTVGKLNFSGWRRMSVRVPESIAQRDLHFSNSMGIRLRGFRIECDLRDTMGTYYVYFDDLRALTDLFPERNRDADDIPDTW
ncbi:MAG: flagellar filament outer layer protein FlaA [Spirochaetales bacterium]|jgi:hypothetical protein|nr:flagellar filament outer layer protein FlaA [Spirochaetales bacterium]